jgi:hypothetical protein
MNQVTYSLILSVMFTILADYGSLIANEVVGCFGDSVPNYSRTFTVDTLDQQRSQV